MAWVGCEVGEGELPERGMRDHTRRDVAYIVGRMAGLASGSVYDHAAGRSISIAGTVEQDAVNVYDYERRVHLSGARSLDGVDVFDHGHRARLQLALRSPGRFVGYDHATNSLFEIRAQGRVVEVFDFQTRRSYAYSV